MIESLILRYVLGKESSGYEHNLAIEVKKLSGNQLRFSKVSNYHATDYSFTVEEPRWLELVVAAGEAELQKIGTGTYYYESKSDSYDSVYLLELLDYRIFVSEKSSFLWLTTQEEIDSLNVPEFLYRWRNVQDTNGHYKCRHEMAMECLLYLSLVEHEKTN